MRVQSWPYTISCARTRPPRPRGALRDGPLVRRLRGRAADRGGVASRSRDDRVAHARRATRLRRRHASQRAAEPPRHHPHAPPPRDLRAPRGRCQRAPGDLRHERGSGHRSPLRHGRLSRGRLSARHEADRDVVPPGPRPRARRARRRADARQGLAVPRQRHRLRALAHQRRLRLADGRRRRRPRRLLLALGVLVGALTLGKASPYLVNAIGSARWRINAGFASLMAVVAVVLVVFFVREGPYALPNQPFDIGQIAKGFRNRGVRLANFGYFGHMWELYAMWTWAPVMIRASLKASGDPPVFAEAASFLVIGAGALGCVVAGRVADRIGRPVVASAAMAGSGACCLG